MINMCEHTETETLNQIKQETEMCCRYVDKMMQKYFVDSKVNPDAINPILLNLGLQFLTASIRFLPASRRSSAAKNAAEALFTLVDNIDDD